MSAIGSSSPRLTWKARIAANRVLIVASERGTLVAQWTTKSMNSASSAARFWVLTTRIGSSPRRRQKISHHLSWLAYVRCVEFAIRARMTLVFSLPRVRRDPGGRRSSGRRRCPSRQRGLGGGEGSPSQPPGLRPGAQGGGHARSPGARRSGPEGSALCLSGWDAPRRATLPRPESTLGGLATTAGSPGLF